MLSVPEEEKDTNEKWMNLKNCYKEIEIKPEHLIKNELLSSDKFVFEVLAAVIETDKNTFKLNRVKNLKHISSMNYIDDLTLENTNLKMNASLIRNYWKYSKLKYEQIKDDIDLFYCFPRREIIIRFWNIPENQIFKKIRSWKYLNIGINSKFFIRPDFLQTSAFLVDSKYNNFVKIIKSINDLND